MCRGKNSHGRANAINVGMEAVERDETSLGDSMERK